MLEKNPRTLQSIKEGQGCIFFSFSFQGKMGKGKGNRGKGKQKSKEKKHKEFVSSASFGSHRKREGKNGKRGRGKKKGKMGGKDLSPFVLNIFDNSGKFPLYC